MRPRRVVVVGDVLLDRDVRGTSDRLCPDAPAPVVDVVERTQSPGGAGLAALLCAEAAAVTVVAPFADDADGRLLRRALAAHAGVLALGHEGPTRTKTRVRVGDSSVVRVDDGGPGAPTWVDLDGVRRVLAAADAVLVSDYGAGTTRHEGLRALLAEAAAHVPVVWDPHPRGGAPVPRCRLVTPNLSEALRWAPDGPPDVVAAVLCDAWDADAVAVTLGDRGASVGRRDDAPLFVPAPAVAGGDSCGAGDRFAASAALALSSGTSAPEAVHRAVAAASGWVAAGGAAAYRTGRPTTHLGAAPAGESLHELGERLRARGPVVATGGCFDLLHAGHVATLEAARRLGSSLVVLLNADASVRRLKGAGRPVVPADARRRVLEALDCVDAVVVFDDDDPSGPLSALRPDVWAKGGDYDVAHLPEAATVRAYGGRVVLVPFVDGWSTTDLVARATVAAPPA